MSKLYVYLMRSRNKDNKDIEHFKERTKVILEYEENEDKINLAFEKFVKEGVKGEKSRLYKSVNSRNENIIKRELFIRFLRDSPSVTKINRVLASVAQSYVTRDEKKWLFDFDETDITVLNNFLSDIPCENPCENTVYQTPNGYAIVVEHGFDTRELMKKYSEYDITLKKDDMLFLRIESC